jgi:hypothetical protein
MEGKAKGRRKLRNEKDAWRTKEIKNKFVGPRRRKQNMKNKKSIYFHNKTIDFLSLLGRFIGT